MAMEKVFPLVMATTSQHPLDSQCWTSKFDVDGYLQPGIQERVDSWCLVGFFFIGAVEPILSELHNYFSSVIQLYWCFCKCHS
jgi:hypothetical protein